ncbi:T9SS type A sorting domain-containing protein, partial [Hanstruepera flava]|uniref:T9SS type A sorting domain-containing protein n=1 Tax=Hanstruepera flava TaxID=2930218 RepID=UPI002028D028
SVTEFDNIVANVAFGTYNYTFTRPGACDVTGTVTVDCSTIEAQSGNVFLPIFSEDQTSANVFVSTSSNPIIGAWVDGDIELTDGNNTYNYSVTEFDNIVANVAFGTYNYTFTRPGACDVTGTVTVDCSTIEAQSGNVFLPIFSEDASIDSSVTQNAEMLTANVSGVGIEYQWVDCNNGNAPINGETNQMFTATTNGSYAVIITNTNCGVSDTSACFEVNTLSVTSIETPLSIKVYPNPVVNSVNISLGRTYEDVNIKVYSITGQLINSINKTNSVDCNLDMANLPSGNYILKINADGNIKSSIVIKK